MDKKYTLFSMKWDRTHTLFRLWFVAGLFLFFTSGPLFLAALLIFLFISGLSSYVFYKDNF